MRFLPLFCILFLAAAASLHAQQQESKLEQRIKHPNMSLTFDPGKSQFSALHSFNSKSAIVKSAYVKEFAYDQKYTPKDFLTHSYGGTKSAWTGEFQVNSKSSPTQGKSDASEASKSAPVKSAAVKSASESGKTMAVSAYAGNRPYLKHGPRDHFLDRNSPTSAGWTGDDMHAMTIDDIRDLLNKSK